MLRLRVMMNNESIIIVKKPKGKYNDNSWSIHKRDAQRKRSVKYRYGLTLEEYTKLVKMKCEICGKIKKNMVIDHNHDYPGTFRGVLCNSCNVFLGWFESKRSSIIKYAKRKPQNAIKKIKNTSSI